MLRRRLLLALACLAASLPHPAAALEVGCSEPRLAYGQPPLAQIPILSETDAELAGLHAALASKFTGSNPPATRAGMSEGGVVRAPSWFALQGMTEFRTASMSRQEARPDPPVFAQPRDDVRSESIGSMECIANPTWIRR